MSKTDLEAKLARLSHFTIPPADVVTDALDAYAARVADLEAEVARQRVRIGEEVSFQRVIREGEAERRLEVARRHEAERRRLIRDLGFAATIHDRAYKAHREGRKTVRVDALLEGRPEAEEAA